MTESTTIILAAFVMVGALSPVYIAVFQTRRQVRTNGGSSMLDKINTLGTGQQVMLARLDDHIEVADKAFTQLDKRIDSMGGKLHERIDALVLRGHGDGVKDGATETRATPAKKKRG